MKHYLATHILVVFISSLVSLAETDHLNYSCKFPAIYNFGDSNSDTGGLQVLYNPMHLPYGETYFHTSTGRYSDGRLIIDFISEYLRLPFLSPYLDSLGSNFQHGANFASSGATIQPPVQSWFESGPSPFPLDIQVIQYTEFKNRSTFLYAQDRRGRLPNPEEFSKALYVVDIGQNEIASNSSVEEFNAMLVNITNIVANQMQELYSRGARYFWIHNTGPFGCLPHQTIKVQNPPPGYLDRHGCIKWQNERSLRFNALLNHSVAQLRASLSLAAITYVDIYSAKYELISYARKYGFEDPGNICCGAYKNGVYVWCGYSKTINGSEVKADPCKKPSKVISWDSVHYTEAANRWVAKRITEGAFSDPPIPITGACRRQIL